MQVERYAQKESVPPGALTTHDLGKSQKDHFLKLMWFQPSQVAAYSAKPQRPPQGSKRFAVLPQSKLMPNAGYHLPDQADARVSAASPALEVMTDLRRFAAITIDPSALIEEANHAMIIHRIRALFVGDEQRLLGIITAADILGEKPLQLTQQRGIRHDEVLVRDIMTPADQLEVIDMNFLQVAKVGDVVETLKRSGRQHALAVHKTERGKQLITGIFSLTQIARQMGISLGAPDIARTFAEIEKAIAW